MDLKICNVVCCGQACSSPTDIESFLPIKRFTSAVCLKLPNCSVLFFKANNKFVMSGFKSESDAFAKACDIFGSVNILSFKVTNIVAHYKLSNSLDLPLTFTELCKSTDASVLYEPELFCALVFRPLRNVPRTFNIFRNGKIACFGFKSENGLRLALTRLLPRLVKLD